MKLEDLSRMTRTFILLLVVFAAFGYCEPAGKRLHHDCVDAVDVVVVFVVGVLVLVVPVVRMLSKIVMELC